VNGRCKIAVAEMVIEDNGSKGIDTSLRIICKRASLFLSFFISTDVQTYDSPFDMS
jgi:hypothetical protein